MEDDPTVRPGRLQRWVDRLGERQTRALNLTVALAGIVLTAPIMLVIGLLVKLSSPGPVLFTQTRVGVDQRLGRDRRRNGRAGAAGRRRRDRGGRIFTIFKFRTMTATRTKDPQQIWARTDDPRITRVGAVLRKYRLDELPQLFNVLKGDMNVVGPRPEQPEIFEQLADRVDGYRLRQRVLPGITGWAQVNHRYDQCLADVHRKLALDLEYIGRRSTTEDVKIMARTIPIMVGKKGAV
jgi:lipopolysaccharide/colanic/teichoic acid biosynthesis glycosyltransferase